MRNYLADVKRNYLAEGEDVIDPEDEGDGTPEMLRRPVDPAALRPVVPIDGGVPQVIPRDEESDFAGIPNNDKINPYLGDPTALDDPGPDDVEVTHTGAMPKPDRWAALQSELASRPVMTEPKWWQRVAAGAMGGLAGWSNAAGRTKNPIDIGATSEAILHPGYEGKLAQWQSRVAPLQSGVEIEGQRVAAQQAADLSKANIADKQADAAYKNGLGRTTAVKVSAELAEASNGRYKEGDLIPGNLAAELERKLAGKYDPKPVKLPVTFAEKDAELQQLYPDMTSEDRRQAIINPSQFMRAPKADPVAQENINHWVAVAEDPDATQADRDLANAKLKRLRDNQVATHVSITNSLPQNQPAKPILPGTAAYRTAQQLSSGKLTFDQFNRLYGRTANIQEKKEIFDLAGTMNDNFDPALFAQGYKFFSSPKIQQQMASIANVESGVPDLLKFSDLASRSGATILNKAIIPGGVALGGRNYSNFSTARTAFADELSGALGYGSATDMSREMGFNMTDANLSPENFKAAIQDVIVPFIRRKKASMLGPMGVYGQSQYGGGQPPPAAQPEMETKVHGTTTYQRVKGSKDPWNKK